MRFLSVLVFGLVDRFSALHVRLMLGSVCLAEHVSRRTYARLLVVSGVRRCV